MNFIRRGREGVSHFLNSKIHPYLLVPVARQNALCATHITAIICSHSESVLPCLSSLQYPSLLPHYIQYTIMSTAAEVQVRKLAKLPSNTICPNCGVTQKHGFGTVCIKFHTFVCNDCKSSHQAISHRCKSITMSSWTNQEVQELQSRGNDYCRNTWLQHAPPCGMHGRPQPGSDIAVYKAFVVDVYERRKYFGEMESSTVAAAAAAAAAPSQQQQTKALPTRKTAPAMMAAPAPAVADLLDFSVPPTTAATTATADLAFADFGDFQTAPSPVAAPAVAPAPTLAPPPPSAPMLAPPPPSTMSTFTNASVMNNFAPTTMQQTNVGMMNTHNAMPMMNGGNNMMSGMMMNNNNAFPMNSDNAFQNGGFQQHISGMGMQMNHGGGMAFPSNNAFGGNMNGEFQSNNSAFPTNGTMNGGGMPFQTNNAFPNSSGMRMNMSMMNQQHQQPMTFHAQGMNASMNMNGSLSNTQQNNDKKDPFAGLGSF